MSNVSATTATKLVKIILRSKQYEVSVKMFYYSDQDH